MFNDFESKLDKYAELAVKVGLNVQPGQRLVVDAELGTAPLVRLVTRHAYAAGARFVNVHWWDQDTLLIRFQNAPRDSFEEISEGYVLDGIEAARRGDAALSILASDPDLLKEQDPTCLETYDKTRLARLHECLELAGRARYNWLVISYPIPSWASRVFPQLEPAAQVESLWELIFKLCRITTPEPVSAWQAHLGSLRQRKNYLNTRRYTALKFTGPGTDLTVGLSPAHQWMDAEMVTPAGIRYIPNLPTEEIFTMPHRDRVNGVVTSTKPLSVRGVLIQEFTLRFENGAVVEMRASNHQDVLNGLIHTDEGSSHLGEVALVSQSSPVAQADMLFYNALFDENAASHLALGKAYPDTLKGGEEMSSAQLAELGANESLIHTDWMIGSGQVDVDGMLEDDTSEPVMRKGEWAFTLSTH